MRFLLMLIFMLLFGCRALQDDSEFNPTENSSDPIIISDVENEENLKDPIDPYNFNNLENEINNNVYYQIYPDDIDKSDSIGLVGGHFDLDTSTNIYDFNSGETNKHEHEYDNKHSTTEANFFNLIDKDFDEVQEVIGDENFIIILANADLSPNSYLNINGKKINVIDYQKNVDSYLNGDKNALKIFNLKSVTGAEQLKSFKLQFDYDAIIKGGLVPTNTSCVRKNVPGRNGEYRSGALAVQLINIDKPFEINEKMRVAEKGSDLLWEATVFWHWDGECY